MSLKVKKVADGPKNFVVQVSGKIKADHAGVQPLFSYLELASLAGKGLRIDSVLFALQEKMGILLWWDKAGTDLILPLESRGYFSFAAPISSSDDWEKVIYFSAFKLDEDKHLYINFECEHLR